MKLYQATPDDRALIRHLAICSWKVAYADILSDEQLTYMIRMTYSDQSLKEQMQNRHMFFIAYADDHEPIGFISLNPKTIGLYVLEKLYVLPQQQGKGIGRFLVEHAETYIRNRHQGQQISLELNVNRNNKAVDFYKRMNFYIDRTVNEDIGNGFYKNDYIMQKVINC